MKRFVISSLPRTGTHLLRSSLQEHPQIHCMGEYFHPQWAGGQDRPSWLRALVEQNGATFATTLTAVRRSYFEEPRAPAVTALGLCLHADQEAPDQACTPWPHKAIVQTVPDLHVIRLERRDALAACISMLVAERTDKWRAFRADEVCQPEPFAASPQKVVEYLHVRKNLRRQADACFAGLPCLDIDYEELVLEYDAVMECVFAFLAVPSRSVTPRTWKQGRWPIHDVILNADEVLAEVRLAHADEDSELDTPTLLPDVRECRQDA